MKWTLLIAGYSCIFFTSCAGHQPNKPAGIATKTENAPKISFGLYDIAKGPSFFDMFESQTSPTYQRGSESNASLDSSVDTKNEQKPAEEKATALQTDQSASPLKASRKVIKNAEIHLEAAEPDASQRKIGEIAEANGGYLVESQQSMSDVTSNVRDSVSITIRVPSERFTEAVDAIRGSADRLLVESEKGEDVTEEFVDLTARLRAKRALESQFLEIMKQADTVEDALNVQTQLSNVRSDIEEIEGRIRFLESQSTFSTIKAHIHTPAMFTSNSVGIGYRLTDSAGRGMDAALNFTLNFMTFIIGAIPFTLFVGMPIFLIGRAIWKRQKTPATTAEIVKEEIQADAN
ncbi:MAG: DUF4349 domain-containing protein [Blastocatellia bacterium]|nr:DUF4349 domain-containing protein [Blastocatellia bacterium]